ncbi:MAG: hypothetical protein ABIP65_01620 [Vicinamibacterales bacterium]
MTTTILKERRMVRRFEEAGALSPDSARSLEQLELPAGRVLRRLRERLVIRQVNGDRFYIDQEAWAMLRKRRRRHASVAAIAAAALILGILLFTRTAHAGVSPAPRSAPEVHSAGCAAESRSFS